MSKASSPIKVLRTALKRVEKGWTQDTWHEFGVDGKHYVCLEGAIYGYCRPGEHEVTQAQREADEVVLAIIGEKYGFTSIPTFNDFKGRVRLSERAYIMKQNRTTVEEVMEVIKLAIIRLETTPDGLDDEDIDDLLEYMDEQEKNHVT